MSVDLNWDTGVYSMQVHLGAVFFNNSPVFTVDGSLQFNSQGDILLTATAAVHVPSDVPIIGGDSLSMSFAFYEHSGSGYFAAWIGFDIPFFGEQDIGFKYDLGGDFSLLGTSGVQEIQAQKFTPTPTSESERSKSVERPIFRTRTVPGWPSSGLCTSLHRHRQCPGQHRLRHHRRSLPRRAQSLRRTRAGPPTPSRSSSSKILSGAKRSRICVGL